MRECLGSGTMGRREMHPVWKIGVNDNYIRLYSIYHRLSVLGLVNRLVGRACAQLQLQ